MNILQTRSRRGAMLVIVAGMVLPSVQAVQAQVPGMPPRPAPAASAPATAASASSRDGMALKFDNTPLPIVLQAYAEETGRTLLLGPGVPTLNVTLRSQTDLSTDEYLLAIETVLSLHGVALLPVDERFVKVVPLKEVRRLGIQTDLQVPDDGRHAETGQLVSQMIELKHIDLNEAKNAIEGFKRGEGQLQIFERTNSVLITDTADNVNRMIEILRYLDQPLILREEPNVRQIRYARASEIKQKIEEIIAEQQRAQQQRQQRDVPQARTAGAPGIERRTPQQPVPGVIRPRGRTPPDAAESAPATSPVLETMIEEAERGIIRGSVLIVADDRTNVLIIITRPENMIFFDHIINVLDIETSPDVVVEVVRMEHADAEEVAGMLNDLIGARSADERSATPAPDAADAPDAERSARLQEFLERRRRETGTPPMEAETRSKVGELNRESITILANKRTNALILMASQSDLATLKEIIRDMDIMLSQVLIETVILEVNLEEKLATGVDWVQRAMVAYAGSGAGREPWMTFASRGGGGAGRPLDPLTLDTAGAFPTGAGLNYYASIMGLNLDVILQASASDSRTRILSSPVILTQDNKEATIEATTRQYFFKGKRYVGTGTDNRAIYEDDVEQREVGITLKVLPRINERGFVVMTVEQAVENIAGTQRINEADWPIVSSRRLGADIAVTSGETVILGGLVLNNRQNVHSRVPWLGRIPLLGALFRSSRYEDARSEVMVFLTPYVLDTPDALAAEALRRKRATGAGDMWRRGWSDSRLADPAPGEETQPFPPPAGDPPAPDNAPPSRHPEAVEAIQRTFGR